MQSTTTMAFSDSGTREPALLYLPGWCVAARSSRRCSPVRPKLADLCRSTGAAMASRPARAPTLVQTSRSRMRSS